jgi:acyl dehydratase
MPDLPQVGDEIVRRSRAMTAERMRWYADALETCSRDDGLAVIAEVNIHTSDEFAQQNGLPARVSDGMVSTNWISNALTEVFGDAYLATGALTTRFRRPIFVDEKIDVAITVAARETTETGAIRITMDVACTKSGGEVATSGTASVLVPA